MLRLYFFLVIGFLAGGSVSVRMGNSPQGLSKSIGAVVTIGNDLLTLLDAAKTGDVGTLELIESKLAVLYKDVEENPLTDFTHSDLFKRVRALFSHTAQIADSSNDVSADFKNRLSNLALDFEALTPEYTEVLASELPLKDIAEKSGKASVGVVFPFDASGTPDNSAIA